MLRKQKWGWLQRALYGKTLWKNLQPSLQKPLVRFPYWESALPIHQSIKCSSEVLLVMM